VALYFKSYDLYQKANKKGKKGLIVARPLLSKPLEKAVFDLVDPLCKEKDGYRFMFNDLCWFCLKGGQRL